MRCIERYRCRRADRVWFLVHAQAASAKFLLYSFFIYLLTSAAALPEGQVRSTPPPDSVPTIKENARQVLAPAIVTDKKGRPVSGSNSPILSS
ncbi:MAG: hypothetical protein M3Y57_19320 [Acidobacteriota bacterium]|nr:hypothetical protein [Acidobacteriota bacterium]